MTDDKPRLMSPKDAAIATSLSRPLLSLMAAEGEFPKPVRLGERRIAFVRAEVEAWIDARIAARPANDNASRKEVAA
jgi:Predicted transcriptional regulator